MTVQYSLNIHTGAVDGCVNMPFQGALSLLDFFRRLAGAHTVDGNVIASNVSGSIVGGKQEQALAVTTAVSISVASDGDMPECVKNLMLGKYPIG